MKTKMLSLLLTAGLAAGLTLVPFVPKVRAASKPSKPDFSRIGTTCSGTTPESRASPLRVPARIRPVLPLFR
jgi:hypothetical protein